MWPSQISVSSTNVFPLLAEGNGKSNWPLGKKGKCKANPRNSCVWSVSHLNILESEGRYSVDSNGGNETSSPLRSPIWLAVPKIISSSNADTEGWLDLNSHGHLLSSNVCLLPMVNFWKFTESDC